jgi:hypothetical protein
MNRKPPEKEKKAMKELAKATAGGSSIGDKLGKGMKKMPEKKK